MEQENHKVDLRVKKTRAAIKETFKQMVCEMDPSEITVKELSDRAMIHRKTFYLHYTCIEALFEDVISEIAEDYYKEIDKIPENMPMLEVNRVFFEFYSRQEPYVERIMCAPEYQDFFDKKLTRHNHAAQPRAPQSLRAPAAGRTEHNKYFSHQKFQQYVPPVGRRRQKNPPGQDHRFNRRTPDTGDSKFCQIKLTLRCDGTRRESRPN